MSPPSTDLILCAPLLRHTAAGGGGRLLSTPVVILCALLLLLLLLLLYLLISFVFLQATDRVILMSALAESEVVRGLLDFIDGWLLLA